MSVDVNEEISPSTLFSYSWERIQRKFLNHLERLPGTTTTDLPQSLVIQAKYDARIHGTPLVEMNFATAETRRWTTVGISDDYEGMTKTRFYRDGQLVRLSGKQ